MTLDAAAVADRLRHRLVPAVPVPFRGDVLAERAQQEYAAWMAARPVAGVAVWAHTGRGRHLRAEQRQTVLEAWREAMPDRVIIAGAGDIGTAIQARRHKADALLAFPERNDPIAYHTRLSRELPTLAFWLYEAAGGVAYDDATLHGILELPGIVGIKVATLDSIMTFQRIAGIVSQHSGKLLVTGEDRFLAASLMGGAESALIGMGAALPDLQAGLLEAHATADWSRFHRLAPIVDRFAQTTFIEPMEGYVRRMLWAAAAEGALDADACDDPWGPALPPDERELVRKMVHDAREAGA
jgi:4-hydroxy-tetrahydrodipicolinate synthase